MQPNGGAHEADEIREQIRELEKDAELDDMDEVNQLNNQNNEGWVDEMEELTQAQQDNVIEGIQLICLILMKASVYLRRV